jgi:hypothetical protein
LKAAAIAAQQWTPIFNGTDRCRTA